MNTLETWRSIVEVLGWTLIHFTWQGTLVALSLAGVLRMLRGSSTNTRYTAACVALLLMSSLPLFAISIISLSMSGKTASGPPPQFVAQTSSQPQPVEIEPAIVLTQTDIASASPRPWLSFRPAPVTPLLPWMILLWLLGVVFFSFRLVGGWFYTQRLKSYGTRPLEEGWEQTLRRLCDRLRAPRPARLLESALVKVPMVIGWLRPVILLPVGALTGLTPQQLEAIIAHELAHIRRHDYLINLLQAVVETLLFYHPAVWWVSRRIRQEREHCCDDLAVVVCGDALTYARALLEMEQIRAAGPQLAVAANGGLLMNRIQRLIGAQPQQANRFTGLVASLIALIAVVSVGVGAQSLLPSDIRGSSNAGRQTQNETLLKGGKLDPCETLLKGEKLDPCEMLLKGGKLNPCETLLEGGKLDPGAALLKGGKLDPCETMLKGEKLNPCETILKGEKLNPCESLLKPGATLLKDELKQGGGESLLGASRGLFDEQTAIAPGPPYKYIGLIVGKTGMTATLQSQSDGKFLTVKKGVVVGDRWRVVNITPQKIEIEDTDTRTTHSVINGEKRLSAVPSNFEGGDAQNLKALSSSDPVERAAAACSLGKLSAVEAIPSLINMLGDDTPIQPLKCWDSGHWSPARHTFKQASPGEQAAIALASLSQAAVEPLIAALSNGNPSARRNAAWAIGEIRGGLGTDRSAAVEPLIVSLSDGDVWVRVAAAFSLGEMRPSQATESLIAALGDAEWRVREMAAWALGEMKSRAAVESLTSLSLRDQNERVRRKAVWALGEIRESPAQGSTNQVSRETRTIGRFANSTKTEKISLP